MVNSLLSKLQDLSIFSENKVPVETSIESKNISLKFTDLRSAETFFYTAKALRFLD